jgi:O-antigen/teichoic acid export membrane protein
VKSLAPAALVVGSNLLASIVVMLTQIVLAKYLTPTEFGVWISLMAKINILIPMSLFGITPFWVSVSSQSKTKISGYICSTLKILTVLCIGSFIISIFFLIYSVEEKYRIVFQFMFPILFATVLSTIVVTKYQVEENHFHQAMWTAFPNLLRFVIIITLLNFAHEVNLVNVAEVYFISAVITIFLTIPKIVKLIKNGFSSGLTRATTSDEEFNKTFRMMSKYGFADIAWIVYSQGIIIALSFAANYEGVAVYSLGLLVVNLFYMIPSLYYQKLKLKNLNEKLINNRNILISEVPVMALKNFIIGIIFCFIIINFGSEIIKYLYDDKYKNFDSILTLMALAIPFKLVESYVGAILTNGEFITYKLKLLLIIGFITPAIAYFISTSFGVLGSAFLFLIIEIIIAVLFFNKIFSLKKSK